MCIQQNSIRQLVSLQLVRVYVQLARIPCNASLRFDFGPIDVLIISAKLHCPMNDLITLLANCYLILRL